MKASWLVSVALATLVTACGLSRLSSAQTVGNIEPQAEQKPFRGPVLPDGPLAKAYNEAAKALASADDNPLIAWEYRVWCETGYRSPEDAGTGQLVDQPVDAERDYLSPKGFFHSDKADRLMPQGGIRFLDNAWYFGADGLGVIVVESPEGLLLFDTMSNAWQFKLIESQMEAAELDPADITYAFITHYHADHTGGINQLREVAPGVQVVIGGPDAAILKNARDAVLADRLPDSLVEQKAVPFRSETAETPEKKAELKARRLEAMPGEFDIRVEADTGVQTGTQLISTGSATQVTAILAPGHTPGQTHFIVPVEHDGGMRQLLVMGGNDLPEEAAQYALSTNHLRSIAGQRGADTLINTHGYQGAMYYHLRVLANDPEGPNPFAMGPDGVDRFLGIFAECQRATYNRLKDGTWKAF